VENAIRHGVARHRGPALVRVRAAREGGELRLEVRDGGAGLGDGAPPREGVGLTNTRARLAELHGAAATFRLENAPDGGARATVRIPFRAAAAEAPRDAALVG
jgi:two-component system, LytTR family, sensor kinase